MHCAKEMDMNAVEDALGGRHLHYFNPSSNV